MKKKLNKAQSERLHAQRRAEERYGIRYNRHVRRDICRQIHEGALLLREQSLRVGIFLVNVEGKQVPVAWDQRRLEVISFLPPNQ